MPSPTRLTEFRTRASGERKNRCQPPEPVRTRGPGGRGPCSSSSDRMESTPPCRGSMSITTRPEGRPVTTPTFASGHCRHHASIRPTSVVASLRPCRVRGCLPGEAQSGRQHEQPEGVGVWQGNTGRPSSAYRRASASGSGPLTGRSPPPPTRPASARTQPGRSRTSSSRERLRGPRGRRHQRRRGPPSRSRS